MPQIAYLLSPKGAMANQQKEKPNVENSPIADYAKNLKNNSFSYNPIKTKVAESPSILNRLMGLFNVGQNKTRAKLIQILTILEKMDESREKDYHIMYMNQEIKKEKDDMRHKEIVNLFVEATKKRKKRLKPKTKPMGGGLPSSLLIAGGAIGLLAFSSDAIAGIKKSIDIDLVDSVEKEFKDELKKIVDSYEKINFQTEYEQIRNFFSVKLFGLANKKEDVLAPNPENYFKEGAEEFPSRLEDVPETATATRMEPGAIPEQVSPLQQLRDTVGTFRRQNETITPPEPPPVTPPQQAQVMPTAPTTAMAAPTPTERPPTFTRVEQPTRRETAQRAASLSIQRETGATTRVQATTKLGQIVNNDPSPGEKSYGIFGMNTRGGIISFVQQFGKQFGLDNIIPGSSEFDKKWIEIARTRSSEFFNAQLLWYENNIISPLEKQLSEILPQDIAKDPRVLIYMADRRLQYHTVGEKRALEYSKMARTPEEFIRLMSENDRRNIEQDFSEYLRNNTRNRQGLINRINEREKASLKSENINFLGSLIDERSREIDLAYLNDSYISSSFIVNNTNIVNQKTIAMSVDPNIHAHPLVG